MDEPDQPSPTSQTSDLRHQLEALPSLNDTKAAVQTAMDQITSAASAAIPTASWQTDTNAQEDWCEEPYGQLGRRSFLPNRIAAKVTVSEQNWADIEKVAKDSAAKVGATDVQVMHDAPGNHDVWFTGPMGVSIKVSYQGNLVVAGYTGCRRP
jgi:hypothetical protein